MEENNKKIYFKGLNGLRFIAAAVVVLHHVEFIKPKMGFSLNSKFLLPGHYGVTLFFVLSGFLISYLLFQEISAIGKVDLKKFYYRRIFKIWPLYFLVVGIGFSIAIANHFLPLHVIIKSLILYLIFLPNVANVFYPLINNIYHLWTIGVEEIFYLFWPLVIIKWNKKIVPISLLVILFFGFGKPVALFIYTHVFEANNLFEYRNQVIGIFNNLEFECMAIGALGAHVLYYKNSFWLKIIYNKIIAYIAFFGVLFFFFNGFYFYLNSVIYSIFFIVFILNISTNTSYKIKLNNQLLEYLGKISYGIYMYHMFCIWLVLSIVSNFITIENKIFDMVVVHIISLLFTVLIAAISYKFFESPFLKLKNKFSVLKD